MSLCNHVTTSQDHPHMSKHRAAVVFARSAVVSNQNSSRLAETINWQTIRYSLPRSASDTLIRPFAHLTTWWSRFSFQNILVMPAVGPLLFSASLTNAASLKAVLDLVDKGYSQDAGGSDEPCLACERLLWLQMPVAIATQTFRQPGSRGDLQSSDVLIAVSMQINKEGMQIHIIDDAQV